MDCRTASLLIEAYHDDELELVDAAHLLAHLEECPACQERCEEAGKLRETLKTCRQVDRCPDELARRLAQRLDVRARRRRTIPRSVTIVFAAGCGIAVGWAAIRLRTPPGHGLALASAVQRVEGELVCLRCAMSRGLPGTRLDGTPHRPLLLTSDGRLFVVRAESQASARLEADGPPRRRVAVLARLDDSNGTADVVDVLSQSPAAASVSSAVAR
ncbi:MAG TPA: zf-HC2 domain-containing protein [Thermoanaerobaculia bacterium]|nr:zf-HC2 domain-containing protein [Thermoanaerobaculia bacterium]